MVTMYLRARLVALLALLCLPLSAHARGLEAEVLAELNYARANPARYADELARGGWALRDEDPYVVDEAIGHVNRYGTKHSEAIVAEDEAAVEAFLARVDAATVYANASTAFTDGAEFGLGAEIGISTQKLHARGPMGLAEMTSTKYVIEGDGQTRA